MLLLRTSLSGVFSSFSLLQNKSTPLHWACQCGHHDVVLTLVEAGVDVNVAAFVRIKFSTALY